MATYQATPLHPENKGPLCWRDAEAAATQLTDTERRTLRLLTRLPLLPATVIEQLNGLEGPASVYRRLKTLLDEGLLAWVRPAIRLGHNPRLWYLTDLGLTVVALDSQVDVTALAQQYHLRGGDLLGRLAGVSYLVAMYELFGAVEASQPGRPTLLTWDVPWRRRFYVPMTGKHEAVHAPAYAAFAWEQCSLDCLLIPDLATYPLQVHRRMLERLLTYRGIARVRLPVLVIATVDEGRADGWRRFLKSVTHFRRDLALKAIVATWDALPQDMPRLPVVTGPEAAHIGDHLPQLQLPPLKPRQAWRPIPQLVNTSMSASHRPGTKAYLGRLSLAITATDRYLLDFVGRHPFLSPGDLAVVMGWTSEWAEVRCRRLMGKGLMRFLTASEVGEAMAARQLVELTDVGLALVAAHEGLSLKSAMRHNGLAGGGPNSPIGSRAGLVQYLRHTLGVNGVALSFYRAAQSARGKGGHDAVIEWRNAAACSHRLIRPDGYLLYRHDGRTRGFFLEYDRGTMRARGYRRKFAGYLLYLRRRLFERDYDSFPTLLIVTPHSEAEERLQGAIRRAESMMGGRLSVVFLREWQLRNAKFLKFLG
ncbi:MAG: replication-relaxation family protein [Anaerolineae bacterium]